jgi:hypothetical protein
MIVIRNNKRNSGRVSGESLAGIFILFLLGTIAASVLVVQGRYDKNMFTNAVPQKSLPADAAVNQDSPPEILSGLEPEGFHPMSDAEIFTAETLSDKIDGKADLYFECDFHELAARRFINQKDPSLWFEVYVYDMKEPRNAFSVYSLQRRPQTPDSGLAPFSYSTENALFFTHGRFYVEIVGAQTSEILQNALVKSGEKIIAAYPSEPLIIREMSFLPPENMQKQTMKYFIKNTFGFEKLDYTLAVNYDLSGKEVMVFISERQGVSEAQTLREDYRKFLLGVGGKSVADEITVIPELVTIELMGETEYFFSMGRFIAGIHAASNRESGDQIARILYDFMNLEMQK